VTVEGRRATPALLQVDAILSRLSGREALQEVCRFFRAEFSHYKWVGIYRLDGQQLVLAAWDGDQPTEHTVIPVNRGICGKAVRERRTVIAEDVRSDPEYLACFLETRSEIVVPIRDGTEILGEIDIDGVAVKGFDATDGRFLEAVAPKLVKAVRAANPPPPVEPSGASLPVVPP
jgi:L-methionine (R)-S-oxide reductase